ncbi:MAG: hypothetical protein JWM88_2009 [Verrucomicrobia bacterium]|nr:hypothetical protein [Verrucomicrobiota bacterium]
MVTRTAMIHTGGIKTPADSIPPASMSRARADGAAANTPGPGRCLVPNVKP